MIDVFSILWELTRAALAVTVVIGAEFLAGVVIALALQAWRNRYGDLDLILWRLHAYCTPAAVYGRRSDDGYTQYMSVDDREAA